ncbi:hypothetical protein BD413DRAFT_615853 [Trametes elegans]|nr:hypothetical protein BD413DRAFT_615853 [Trametes elegans]
MSLVLSRLKSLKLPRHVGPRSLKSQGVSIENVEPVYKSGKLAWWARWTYFLVVADLLMTASAGDLIWNHWTRWEPLPEDPSNPTSKEKPTNPKEVLGQYNLRPLWQRSLATVANMTAGIGFAAMLLGGRSRVITRMFILPAATATASQATSSGTTAAAAGRRSASGRILIIQSPLHSRAQGVVTPLKNTTLLAGSDKNEMVLGVKGRRGQYFIGLVGAQVNGQPLSPWDARKSLFTTWYGPEKGTKMYISSTQVKEAE